MVDNIDRSDSIKTQKLQKYSTIFQQIKKDEKFHERHEVVQNFHISNLIKNHRAEEYASKSSDEKMKVMFKPYTLSDRKKCRTKIEGKFSQRKTFVRQLNKFPPKKVVYADNCSLSLDRHYEWIRCRVVKALS